MAGCTKPREVDWELLQDRNGIAYLPNEEKAFTGVAVKKYPQRAEEGRTHSQVRQDRRSGDRVARERAEVVGRPRQERQEGRSVDLMVRERAEEVEKKGGRLSAIKIIDFLGRAAQLINSYLPNHLWP